MYVSPHFAVPDADAINGLIRAHPLGVLIANTPAGIDANHIPFEFTPQEGEGAHGVLRAHVARSNSIWKDVKDGDEVMVVFRGEEPARQHPAAPTSPAMTK